MKYRVIRSKGAYYPEQKGIFFYSRMPRISYGVGLSTVFSEKEGLGFLTDADALEFIARRVKHETKTIMQVVVKDE